MTLGQIKPGDVVQVDIKGRRFFALAGPPVSNGGPRAIGIEPLSCRETHRVAKAREIVGHYRKAAGSR